MTQYANISSFLFFCDFVKKKSLSVYCEAFFEIFEIFVAPQNERLNLSFVKDKW